jgi:DNA-directed RNA polymerase specialized sigma24 family protein
MSLVANMSEECGLFEILDETSEFKARFALCRGVLRFVASRLLNGPDEIEEAVERCFHTASRYPMRFEYEGEFRSWLVRVLVDEALETRSRRLFRSGRDLRWTAEYWPISIQEGDPV